MSQPDLEAWLSELEQGLEGQQTPLGVAEDDVEQSPQEEEERY